MCPPGYHHSVATHALALGHMIYGYTLLIPLNRRPKSTQQAKQGA